MLEKDGWLFGASIADFAWDAIDLTNVAVFSDDCVRLIGEPILCTFLLKVRVVITTVTIRR